MPPVRNKGFAKPQNAKKIIFAPFRAAFIGYVTFGHVEIFC